MTLSQAIARITLLQTERYNMVAQISFLEAEVARLKAEIAELRSASTPAELNSRDE